MFEFGRLRLQMAPDRIHFLKFILEGYDHMAFQSTINAQQGLVEIRYAASFHEEVLALVEYLAPSLNAVLCDY